MAITTLSVLAALISGAQAIGVLEQELVKQLSSRHHSKELIYTFDKRGLYIKKK